MKTLTDIAIDSKKSIMEREMANSMIIYNDKQKAISHHAKKMDIDESESEQYYDFVIESQYESYDE